MKKFKNIGNVSGDILVNIDGVTIVFFVDKGAEFSIDANDDAKIVFSSTNEVNSSNIEIAAI
ncbi:MULTISPECIES: hypothetical protein [Photobacterium]|uniref:Uncharacterized protein n=1 Tax=Photobacterium alginatilyticum TaxID=1775171 RepID=A0ABW9YQR8_9GAMM|nr:hypothetical protein [Photobacterium alginatilyticum]NBI56273.1 hypothetical protein [Photobacterium alginatilyticum]